MPPPDAETLELRSQLEGLVGKLKAKQEEVASSLNKRKSDFHFVFIRCEMMLDLVPLVQSKNTLIVSLEQYIQQYIFWKV